MATTFSATRRLLRTILGDNDSRKYRYPDEVLDDHFRLAIVIIDEPNIAEDEENESFTEDLSNKDKMRVVLRSALNIISPQPDKFSHKSAVLAVSREGGVRSLKASLEELLTNIESGGTRFAVAVDYSMDALVNEVQRYIDSLDHALASS